MQDPELVRCRVPGARPAAAGGSRSRAALDLLGCPDPDSLVRAAVDAAVPERADRAPVDDPPPVPGRSAFLYLLRDGWLHLAAFTGDGAKRVADRYPLVAVDEQMPVAHAVRTCRPVFAPVDTGREAFLSVRGLGSGSAAHTVLPLVSEGVCRGALLIGFGRSLALTDAERDTLEATADTVAHRVHQLGAAGPQAPDDGSGGQAEARDEAYPNRAACVAHSPAHAARLELAMTAAGAAAFDWDFTTRSVTWDDRLSRILGLRPDDFEGRIESFFDSVHPEDLPAVEAAIVESVESCGDYRAGCRVILPDGNIRWIEVRGRVLAGLGGRPARMTGVVYDYTEQRRRQERDQAHQQARRFHELVIMETTRALSRTLTIDDVIHAVTSVVVPVIHAEGVFVYIDHGGKLRLAGSSGWCDRVREKLRVVDRLKPSPLAAAMETDTPMFYDAATAFPCQADVFNKDHAWALLPPGKPLGAPGFSPVVKAASCGAGQGTGNRQGGSPSPDHSGWFCCSMY